jgi:WD40 repeat protein
MAFAPGGALLACAVAGGNIWLWSSVTGEEIGELRGHARTAFALSFSPNGRFRASGDANGTVKLWDVASKKLQTTLTDSANNLEDEEAALAFAPDSATLAVAIGRVVQLWDVTTGQLVARLEGHDRKVTCLAFLPDGTRLASGSYDRTVLLWDVSHYS